MNGSAIPIVRVLSSKIVDDGPLTLAEVRAGTLKADHVAEKTTAHGVTADSAIDIVTTLSGVVSGKAAASHTHAESEVTNLTSDLSGKAASSHTHAISDVTNLATSLSGKLDIQTPTDDQLHADTASGNLTNGSVFVQCCEYIIPAAVQPRMARIKYNHHHWTAAGQTSVTMLYVNGSPVGNADSITGGTVSNTVSQDFFIHGGMRISVWGKCDASNPGDKLGRNITIYGTGTSW